MKPEDFLNHYGILGMHWGKRSSKGSTSGSKVIKSDDHLAKVTLRKKKVSEMSNADLKSLTTRMQLEKQYKDLSPKKPQRALNFVKGLTTAGTTVASLYALSKTPLAQDLKKIIEARM